MDKVKLHAQERLDLDDARALQTLGADYIEEALGALWGFAQGVLSVPVVTLTENGGAPYLTFSPFTFVSATPVTDRGASVSGGAQYTQSRARVVNYDASEESTPEIDVDLLRATWEIIVASFGAQYLWGRPIAVDTDTATRRKWDITAGAEVTFSAETRTSQRVEFLIQNAEPAYSAGESRWVKLAELTEWTDGDNADSAPVFEWVSAFDDADVNTFLHATDTVGDTDPTDAQLSLARLLSVPSNFPMSAGASLRAWGLVTHLTAIRRQLALISAGGRNDPVGVTGLNWDTAPRLSLSGADQRLSVLEARMTGGVQCIASCSIIIARSGIAEAEYYQAQYDGPSYGVDRTHAIIAPRGQQQNRANVRIYNSILDAGWAVTHVSVTQVKLTDIQDPAEPDHEDYNRVSFVIDPKAYSVDSTDTATMRIDTGTTSQRGVTVEFLPWIMDDGLHAHSENGFHAPDGIATDTTKILDPLPNQTEDLRFTVAVYAVPAGVVES